MPLYLEPIKRTLKNVSVREKSEFLEHHGRLVSTEFAQLRRVHLHHVLVTDQDFTGCWINEAIDVANERGFSRSGEPHDHLDPTGGHGDIDVTEPEHMAMLRNQFRFADTLLHELDARRAIGAEDFVELFDFDAVAADFSVTHEQPSGAFEGESRKPG